jgi:hypothetical protein
VVLPQSVDGRDAITGDRAEPVTVRRYRSCCQPESRAGKAIGRRVWCSTAVPSPASSRHERHVMTRCWSVWTSSRGLPRPAFGRVTRGTRTELCGKTTTPPANRRRRWDYDGCSGNHGLGPVANVVLPRQAKAVQELYCQCSQQFTSTLVIEKNSRIAGTRPRGGLQRPP